MDAICAVSLIKHYFEGESVLDFNHTYFIKKWFHQICQVINNNSSLDTPPPTTLNPMKGALNWWPKVTYNYDIHCTFTVLAWCQINRVRGFYLLFFFIISFFGRDLSKKKGFFFSEPHSTIFMYTYRISRWVGIWFLGFTLKVHSGYHIGWCEGLEKCLINISVVYQALRTV